MGYQICRISGFSKTLYSRYNNSPHFPLRFWPCQSRVIEETKICVLVVCVNIKSPPHHGMAVSVARMRSLRTTHLAFPYPPSRRSSMPINCQLVNDSPFQLLASYRYMTGMTVPFVPRTLHPTSPPDPQLCPSPASPRATRAACKDARCRRISRLMSRTMLPFFYRIPLYLTSPCGGPGGYRASGKFGCLSSYSSTSLNSQLAFIPLEPVFSPSPLCELSTLCSRTAIGRLQYAYMHKYLTFGLLKMQNLFVSRNPPQPPPGPRHMLHLVSCVVRRAKVVGRGRR